MQLIEGIRHYVEFSPAEVWADLFNMAGFADEGKLIGLPVLAPDAGHKFDLGVLDRDAAGDEIEEGNLSEAESLFSPTHPMSPTRRPGRRKSRLETLRETTAVGSDPPVRSLDPARTGRLSRSYPDAPLLSPVRSTRPVEINIISPSQSSAPSPARRAVPFTILPRPRSRRRAVRAAGTAHRASQIPTRAELAARTTAAGRGRSMRRVLTHAERDTRTTAAASVARAAAQARAVARIAALRRARNKEAGDDDL